MSINTGIKLGILGGGQLAQMLAQAAQRMGIEVSAYVEPNSESAASVIPTVTRGTLSDTTALRNYLQQINVAIFESEFVPTESLITASKGLPVSLYPSVDAIALVQNKLKQKKALSEWKIPTADFIEHNGSDSAEQFLKKVTEKFPAGAVLKWATLGYDGKGVFILARGTDSKLSHDFCDSVLKRNGGLFAEALIPFTNELACIGVQSVGGEQATYPVVISEQRSGICNRVYGPAEEFKISPSICDQVREIVRTIGKRGNIIGAYGIELFLTTEGSVLVNEIAPRVHNTGHYTQEGSQTSQFENHIRAVLNLPLGDTSSTGLFLMQNILGPEGSYSVKEPAPLPTLTKGAHLHWYHKSGITPRRKLGHINGVAQTHDEFIRLDQEISERYSEWGKKIYG